MTAQSLMLRASAAAILVTALAAPLVSMDVPPPVRGYPVGWCIRATPAAFADAKQDVGALRKAPVQAGPRTI